MILLTGASGFLGKILFKELQNIYPIIGLCYNNSTADNFTSVNLTDKLALLSILNANRPNIVIHSAAWRDPERCESNPQGADALHVKATNDIAKWCSLNKAKLIYISTDYVFDGQTPPYDEDDPYSPLSIYGQTKMQGELVAQTTPDHLIVRIPLQYGFSVSPDDSFLLKTLSNLASKKRLVSDDYQLRYPTLANDVALAIADLIKINFVGKIHLCSSTGATRFEIIKTIAKIFGIDSKLIVASSDSLIQLANRPKDSKISTKLYDSLNLHQFLTLEDGLLFARTKIIEAKYDWKSTRI